MLNKHRLQVANIKRNMYRELRIMGWTAKAAKKNVNETIEFMNAIQQLVFEHGDTVTVNIE